jgi:tRNA U38,U39,U40 pseudouridine synthase TruA
MIKRSKFLKFKFDKSNHSAIKVINTVVVSKFASATVLECSGSSFLVVSNRNGAPAVVELPKERENKLFTKTDLELEGT